jgi:hypothetical protein
MARESALGNQKAGLRTAAEATKRLKLRSRRREKISATTRHAGDITSITAALV